MKLLKNSYFLLLLYILIPPNAFSQESIVQLSSSEWDNHERFNLATMDGWIFHEGHNTSWAQNNITLNGWTSFKPTELNSEMADQSGRVEGWFRLRIKLDSSFSHKEWFLGRKLWAATDIYINGKLIHSFGNTGTHYQAFNPNLKSPVPIVLEANKEYLIAVHFVDYETTFTSRELRLKPKYLESLIVLGGPAFPQFVQSHIKKTYGYGSVSISVSFLLFFLFWLLVFLNPAQKIFRLIAYVATAVFLSAIGYFFDLFVEFSYSTEKIRFVFTNYMLPLMTVLTLLATEWVLKNKTTKLTLLLLLLLPIASVIAHLFDISPPFGILNLTMLVYFGYLIFTSWKNISPSQWLVVAGMIVPTIGGALWVTIHKYQSALYYEYENQIVTLVMLSAPLLLLVYISLRFKEILHDVSEEAKKVIKISEEKKELLLNQNENLENQIKERTKEVVKQKETAEQEKERSEELLLNILPAEVAAELKTTGRSKAKAFTMVTVMFTDFKDFTKVGEKVSAELLVEEIHHCFSAFDHIIQKYKIEKIKTIGDAYLCAGGLPVTNYTHANDMVSAASEIRKFMLQRKLEKEAKGEIPFEIRIGLHTGPVVAGIVGVKKYAYDIWGDTVNLAARMEQNCDAGKINISGSTYELVKENFTCTHRGKIQVKNKGEVDMYYVDSKLQ